MFSILYLLCLCAHLFICALWSPAGKGQTAWLSFVVSNCEFFTFPLVSWVRLGAWLYRFLIFAPLLTFPIWCPVSGVVLDCIDYWSLPSLILCYAVSSVCSLHSCGHLLVNDRALWLSCVVFSCVVPFSNKCVLAEFSWGWYSLTCLSPPVLLTVPGRCFLFGSFLLFMFRVSLCCAILSVPCSLVVACVILGCVYSWYLPSSFI